MPEHSPIINVCPSPTGNLSWNTVMGAYAVKVPSPYGNFQISTRNVKKRCIKSTHDVASCYQCEPFLRAFSENVLQLIEPGSPLWMTREEYIVFGVQKIATFDSCIREG